MPNVFIDWKCFSGERCGPWASCFITDPLYNVNFRGPMILTRIAELSLTVFTTSDGIRDQILRIFIHFSIWR